MNDPALEPQIYILDTGGQYTHLIARKVRELGVYAEVVSSETEAARFAKAKGLIISGGPASVYEQGSPHIDQAVLTEGVPMLGICYGQQLMAFQLDGQVRQGSKGEYGLAHLAIAGASPLFRDVANHQQVWMSHRDTVFAPPTGFSVLAQTDTCAIAAIGNESTRQFGVQFHPEVVHTTEGRKILKNFVFAICGCTEDWQPASRIPVVEQQIRDIAGDRNIFFFVSGGVDSTVAYTLCLRALGEARVHGAYVDTGMMREGETEFVRGIFDSLGARHFRIELAQEDFLEALEGVVEPERKRKIIGEKFVEIQEAVLESGPYLDGHWILGQGTIYPDTIESGGTAKADLIKTHHNRVKEILEMIEQGRVVEPLRELFKDEVREVGRLLGIPKAALQRHPFPGPGLAVRVLGPVSEERLRILRAADTILLEELRRTGHYGKIWQAFVVLLPVRSVGVMGDARSYENVAAVRCVTSTDGMTADWYPMPPEVLAVISNRIINEVRGINRVTYDISSKPPATIEWE